MTGSVTPRPFRFGVTIRDAQHPDELAALAARAEALGFDTFLCPDHLIGGGETRYLALWQVLAIAARATSSIRVGSLVACNDFRPPALLAKEAATLDWLSGGRLELGLGAGHRAVEYEQMGLRFADAATRIDRLDEATKIVKALFTGEPVHFRGSHYQIDGLEGYPHPIQQPRPPILIGGGSQRVLELAGREAEIVSIIQRVLPDGRGHDWRDLAPAATDRQIEWVREAAGDRFDEIELSTLLQGIAVTDRPAEAAERLAGRFGGSAEKLLESSMFLIGPLDELCRQLLARRERFGISYYVIFGRDMEAFAPILAKLRGS